MPLGELILLAPPGIADEELKQQKEKLIEEYSQREPVRYVCVGYDGDQPYENEDYSIGSSYELINAPSIFVLVNPRIERPALIRKLIKMALALLEEPFSEAYDHRRRSHDGPDTPDHEIPF